VRRALGYRRQGTGLLAALVLAVTLTACGGADGGTAQEPAGGGNDGGAATSDLKVAGGCAPVVPAAGRLLRRAPVRASAGGQRHGQNQCRQQAGALPAVPQSSAHAGPPLS